MRNWLKKKYGKYGFYVRLVELKVWAKKFDMLFPKDYTCHQLGASRRMDRVSIGDQQTETYCRSDGYWVVWLEALPVGERLARLALHLIANA